MKIKESKKGSTMFIHHIMRKARGIFLDYNTTNYCHIGDHSEHILDTITHTTLLHNKIERQLFLEFFFFLIKIYPP